VQSRSGAMGCTLDREHGCAMLFSTTGRRCRPGLASALNKNIISRLLEANAATAEASKTAKETLDARLGDA
jgi:hypothetical protein